MPKQKVEAEVKGKRKVVSIKEIDIKKATIFGGIVGGIIGLVAGIMVALSAISLPIIGFLSGILAIILLTGIGIILGALICLIKTGIINLALNITKGYDIYYE